MSWISILKTSFVPPPGYRIVREGTRQILVRGGFEDYLRQKNLLDAEGLWKNRFSSDRNMGRGEVLLVGHPVAVAVRKYHHGGLFRRITRDIFLFGSRPFEEVAVTEAAQSAYIPTVEVLAAIMERKWGICYRAYLVTRYLPKAVNLVQYLGSRTPDEERHEVIKLAARAVRTMHQSGIYHADLQLRNFLVTRGEELQVHLLDFDRSEIHTSLSPSARIKNLKRLDRSAEKLKGEGCFFSDKDKRLFCRSYLIQDREMRSLVMSYLKWYKWHHFMYTLGWRIARLLYPRQRPSRNSATR